MIAWIDLETSGLATECAIIEIACIVTDEDYNEIGRYESLLKPSVMSKTETVAWKMHSDSGLWEEARISKKDSYIVDEELSDFLQPFSDSPLLLAGSSVHFDRRFIERWLPRVNTFLHYRNLDVSSVKLFMAHASGIDSSLLPPTKSTRKHRAMDDIRDSLEAAKLFRSYINDHNLRVDYDPS